MKKIVRIKESELVNLIDKIITETTRKQKISEGVRNLNKFNKKVIKENDDFEVHGTYTVSNHGGYEIMLSPDGESAKVRDAFGSDNPKTSDWLEIEYIPDDDTLDYEPVIDPNGYNIPLSRVMRVNRFR